MADQISAVAHHQVTILGNQRKRAEDNSAMAAAFMPAVELLSSVLVKLVPILTRLEQQADHPGSSVSRGAAVLPTGDVAAIPQVAPPVTLVQPPATPRTSLDRDVPLTVARASQPSRRRRHDEVDDDAGDTFARTFPLPSAVERRSLDAASARHNPAQATINLRERD